MTNLLTHNPDSEAYAEAWVQTAWPMVAAAAYRGFKKHGRGALFVDFTRGQPDSAYLNGFRAPLQFIPAGELPEAALELADAVAAYDPATQAQVVIIRRRALPLYLLVSSLALTPKQAAENQKILSAIVPELRGHQMAMG